MLPNDGGGYVYQPGSSNAAEHDVGIDSSKVPVGPAVVPTTFSASAASNHEMFVALIIMLTFVMLCILVAGENSKVGNGIVGLFVFLLAVQGITKVNPFVAWIANHPLTPYPQKG